MNNALIGILSIISTIVIYLCSRAIYQKFQRPYTLPILISTILIIIGLVTFHIPYETYQLGGKWISHLLGPAVVALAFPLYLQRRILIQNAGTILVSVLIGSMIGVSSGLLLGKLMGFERFIILSLLPKSVTTPVAMDIAQTVGGAPSLAAVLVMFAGIGGAVIGPTLFRLVGITDHLAKGLGMGSASHAIGTAKAMEVNIKEGAVSTVSMVLSAIIVSVITPMLVILFM